MEDVLATAEGEVLVKLVKLAQKLGLKGKHGSWKEFLDFYDKQLGSSSLSDPSKRRKDDLVAFLTTLKKKEDLQLLARVLKLDNDVFEKCRKKSPNETTEQRLVRMTLTHDEYPLDYLFPSNAEDWVITGLGKKKMEPTKIEMIAIDCEMVLCEDGSEALVRVAAVDRDLKVILDEFVKPNQPVVDYRTFITGLTAQDLEKATLSVVDIQEKLLMFLSEDTILVGQSLNHDLKVLKMDHARVIDTSLVFKYNYDGTRRPLRLKRPSLNHLCKCILGYEVQKEGVPHNCVHDAEAAMKLVLAILENGVETSVPLSKEMLEAEKSKLYLHKIPCNVPYEELNGVVSRDIPHEVKVILDEFVKPNQPVVDYRTFITGLTAQDLEKATLSVVDIQEKLLMFLSEDTILVGQSLNHDLKVLKMDHARVIDTSLVFKYNYDGTRRPLRLKRPSLNHLCKCILGYEVQKEGVPHNCVHDAEAAMKLVLAILENGVETSVPLSKEMLEAEKSKLYLHKIPCNVPYEELNGVVSRDIPHEVKPSKKQDRHYYSAIVVFRSPEEANQAFENIAGDLGKDSTGLSQKQVFLELSSSGPRYVLIRKMVEDDLVGEVSAEEKNASSKKRKREKDSKETRERRRCKPLRRKKQRSYVKRR